MSTQQYSYAVDTFWLAYTVMQPIAGAIVDRFGLRASFELRASPSEMKAIAEWLPARRRSVATGWFNAGTSRGTLIEPPVVIAVMLWGSLRLEFIVTGGLAILGRGLVRLLIVRRASRDYARGTRADFK